MRGRENTYTDRDRVTSTDTISSLRILLSLQYALLQTVVDACQKKRHCKFAANSKTHTAGDPCSGIRKFVEIAYKCRPCKYASSLNHPSFPLRFPPLSVCLSFCGSAKRDHTHTLACTLKKYNRRSISGWACSGPVLLSSVWLRPPGPCYCPCRLNHDIYSIRPAAKYIFARCKSGKHQFKLRRKQNCFD